MKKINLPAILLKGNILLPQSELRLEFDNDSSKNIIEISEYFHNNLLFIITQIDPLEDHPKISDYPKIGTISRIEHKLELPNGKTRVVIKGLDRATAYNYIQTDDRIESIIEQSEENIIQEEKEMTLMRKLSHEVQDYIKEIPYVSNSMLSLLQNTKSLSEMTDIVTENIPITSERKRMYLENFDPISRMEMLLTDIYSQKQMYEIEKDIENKVKQNLDRSQKEYLIKEKINILQKELGISDVRKEDIEKIRNQMNSNVPKHIYNKIETEIKRYETIPELSPEIVGVRNYIDTLIHIPWNIYTETEESFLQISNKLNESHYGLFSLKERVLEHLLVNRKKLTKKGAILCLVGPPGTGKTSFAHAVADVLGKKFVKISVGGIDDSSEIVGHRRTYLGATPGRIIEGLIKAGSMNPVFLIDEIDKMVKNYKGDPSSSLLEVLDSYQNNKFIDHYVDEEVDLSEVFFITTANNIEDIPSALKDRLEIIQMKGYTEFEKLEMTRDYLLPKLYKDYGINGEIVFKSNAILKVISDYTEESGVRDLERKLSSIIRKILMEFETEKKQVILTEENIDKYLKDIPVIHKLNHSIHYGTVNALAYLQYKGDVIPIEITSFKGNNNIILTGCLGDILKESITIALSYVKSNYKRFHISMDYLENRDIHIHIPLGAISKEGPSAGMAFVSSIISYFTRRKIDKTVAFTGEISLNGQIYGIGSFKEKCIGAYKNGIKTIYCPKENEKEVESFPQDLKNGINFVFVKNYIEVYQSLFEHKEFVQKDNKNMVH